MEKENIFRENKLDRPVRKSVQTTVEGWRRGGKERGEGGRRGGGGGREGGEGGGEVLELVNWLVGWFGVGRRGEGCGPRADHMCLPI